MFLLFVVVSGLADRVFPTHTQVYCKTFSRKNQYFFTFSSDGMCFLHKKYTLCDATMCNTHR